MWLWASPERRFYVVAFVLGFLLLVWGAFQALLTQGRITLPEFQWPNPADVSLPGRPVLIPIVPFGQTTTLLSAPARSGYLYINKEDQIIAETVIPPDAGTDREFALRVTSNLPRVMAPPPPLAGFQPLRLLDIEMIDVSTQQTVDWRDREVTVRVAIRPIDLDRAGGDPTRLLLLHYDTVRGQWEDTHARVENGFLVARVLSLSPFAVGIIVPGAGGFADVISGVLGLRAPTPTPETPAPSDPNGAPTPEALPSPTPAPGALPGAPAGPPGGGGSPTSTPAVPTLDLDDLPTPAAEPTDEAPTLPAAEATPALDPSPLAGGTAVVPPTASTRIDMVTPVTPRVQPSPAATGDTTSPTPDPSSAGSAKPAPTQSGNGPVGTPTPTPVLPAPTVNFAGPGGASVPRLFNEQQMNPGDTAVANVVVQNSSAVDVTYLMSTSATTPSLLTSDPVDGLQMSVYRCGASFTLCGPALYSGPAVTGPVPLGGPYSVGSGGSAAGLRPSTQDYLQIRIRFPLTAGNSFKAEQSVLSFTWTATQAP